MAVTRWRLPDPVGGGRLSFGNQRLFESGALLLWVLTPFPLVLIVLNLRNYFATRQLIFIIACMIILLPSARILSIPPRYFSPV